MGETINWDYCQRHSDSILAEGLYALQGAAPVSPSRVAATRAGNYLITLDGVPYYVGEAQSIAARVRQRFRAATSTFYRTYAKKVGAGVRAIEDFEVRSIGTDVGRKELEECGIVTLRTRLNKFQLGKRAEVPLAGACVVWLEVQAQSVAVLAQGEETALGLRFSPWFEAQVPHRAGLYVVRSPDDALIYVGESSDVGARYKTHSGRTYFSALRRHVGTDLLGFSLQVRGGKAREFFAEEEEGVTAFLSSCRLAFLPISLGRFELEELLIRKYRPVLNRKANEAA